jgi:hypothetical protein
MFYKKLALFNCIIASSALVFQTTVLYPWHKDISIQITRLQEKLDKK